MYYIINKWYIYIEVVLMEMNTVTVLKFRAPF
jgi:hypothetical protein